MQIFRPLRKHVKNFKEIRVKLKKLRSQDTECLCVLVGQSEYDHEIPQSHTADKTTEP